MPLLRLFFDLSCAPDMYASRESSISSTPTGGTPQPSQAPKFGMVIPNRVFIGSITSDMTEVELKQFFSAYGPVKDCKVIMDRAGISKSYGFVTFESHEVADRIIHKEADGLVFKGHKLNVGPAVRKQQPFSKMHEMAPPPPPSTGMMSPAQATSIVYHNGLPYAVSSGGLQGPPGGAGIVYCQPDSTGGQYGGGQYLVTPQGMAYPVMFSPPSYLPQSYYSSPLSGGRWVQAPLSSMAPPQQQWRLPPQQHASLPAGAMVPPPGGVAAPPQQYLYPVQMMLTPQQQHELIYAPPPGPPPPGCGPSHSSYGSSHQGMTGGCQSVGGDLVSNHVADQGTGGMNGLQPDRSGGVRYMSAAYLHQAG